MSRAASQGGRRCTGCSPAARRAACASLSPAAKATRNAARRAKAADVTAEEKAEANAMRRAAYAARRAAQAGEATASPSSAVTIESLYAEDDRLRDEINAEAIRAHAADPNTFIEPTPEKKAEAAAGHARIKDLGEQRKAIRAEIDRLRVAGS